MISFLDPSGEIFLANLSRIQSGNEKAQEQISSGRKLNRAEDGPDQIAQLLQLSAKLSQNGQRQVSLNNVQTSALTADDALSSILQLLDQASSLGAQAIGATATTESRKDIAQQVQGILSQVVYSSQSQVGGRYVFSGDDDRSPSYQLDSTQPTGVLRLSQALNTSFVEDTNGNRIATGLTAGQIFDHRNADDSVASDNVFAALNSLAQALNADDTTAISDSLTSLARASSYANSQQGFYGSLQNRLTQSINAATSVQLSLTTQISGLRDADFSQAAIDLTQGQTALQAALQARSKVPHTSLFDFLG